MVGCQKILRNSREDRQEGKRQPQRYDVVQEMKLDAMVLRYMTKEEFRVLLAVEMGMKNHELVPTQLINSIAKLKRGGAFKFLNLLHRNKLVFHDSRRCK